MKGWLSNSAIIRHAGCGQSPNERLVLRRRINITSSTTPAISCLMQWGVVVTVGEKGTQFTHASLESMERVILQIVEGNEAALVRFLQCHGKTLLRFCYTLTKDYAISEEIVADVAWRLWSNRSKLDLTKNCTAYVMAICRNLSLNANSTVKRRRELFVLNSQWGTTISVSAPDDDETVDRIAVAQLIRSGLQVLDARHQQIIRMRYYDDLSYKEIATALGIPVGTVKSRLNYALQKLRQAIQKRVD